MTDTPEDTVALLAATSAGDRAAKNKLFTLVYKELHAMAHAAMRAEAPGNVLQTTALLHETYLRLLPAEGLSPRNRKHFLCLAAQAMRRILVDEARRRTTAKRGGGKTPLPLDAQTLPAPAPADERGTFEDLEALDRALEKMEAREEFQRICRIVELLFFAGMTQDETAEILGVSKGTVRRDWGFAKVWLHQEIRGGNDLGA